MTRTERIEALNAQLQAAAAKALEILAPKDDGHRLHLHHPEFTPGPCNPQIVREEAERVKRAARFAADVAWDQRCGTACGRMNDAFWAADAALASLPREAS